MNTTRTGSHLRAALKHPTLAIAFAVAAGLGAGGAQAAITFGPTGTGPLTFDTLPLVSEWSCLSVPGDGYTATDLTSMDALVNTLASTDIATVLPEVTADPGGSAAPGGAWNSTALRLTSRATGTAAAAMMATLSNDSGAALNEFDLNFTLSGADPTGEDPGLAGYAVYYSLTGATDSWQRIGVYGTPGAVTVTNIPLSSAWADTTTLYVLWVDDNGSGGGDGWYGFDDVSFAPSVPLTAPIGLTATPGDAEVDLAWTAFAGATGYNVQLWNGVTSSYDTISTNQAGTTYTHSGLTNGTTYQYVVSAMTGVVESDNSAEVTATPVAPPTPPAGVTGLALWLDASDADTMTLDGGTVNEWRDKMGSAAKMTRDNGAPTVEASGIGGFPTVHFPSGSSMGDGVNHSAPVTIFYVSRQTGGDTGRVLSGGNNWLLGYWGGSRGSAYFEGDVLLGGNGASDTFPHLYATTIGGSGQDSTVWAEGAQIAKNQNGTDGPNGLFVGGGGAYSEYSDCDISEVLVYHRILDEAELEAVGGYLTAKYSLTTSYPTTPQATIMTFGLPGMPATINQTDKTISWTVTYVSDPASLAAEFTISSGAKIYDGDPGSGGTEIASGTVRDFTNPVDYWVKSSDDSITNKYTVTVIHTPISSAKDITSFSYLGIPGTIDGLNITQNVPFGTDLATLAPDYTVSQYFGGSATGSPASGTAPDPSFAVENPATYTVTAQDDSAQDYSVQINVLPEMPTLVNVNYAGPAGTGADMNGIYSFVPTASGSASRAAPSTYGGNTWNDYRSPTASGSNLLDSKGVTTSVGLTTSLEWAGEWADWTGLGGNRMLISGGGAGYTTYKPIFTLSGLDTDHAYDLYIASRINNDNHPTDFAIGGTTKHLENAGATDWAEGDSYVYFANVIPQPDGTLVVNAKGTGAWDGVTVNGFQLQDMGVRGQNPEAFIYTFNSFAGAGPVTIAGTAISMSMPVGSSVSALVPTFTMSTGAVCTLATVAGDPIVSGITPVDFTEPVHFIVKSEDGNTTTDYTVTVNLLVPSGKVYLNNDNTLRTGLVGPAGGLGETWNQRSLSSESGLLDSVGLPSTVGFTCSGTGGWGLGESADFDPTLWMLKQGFANFDANSPNTQQLVITGLDSAKTYDLYIASAILITTNQRGRGEWSTTNTTSSAATQAVDNRADQNSTTWVRGNNYVLFEDVVPDGSGNITVNGSAITEQPTYDIRLALNGFQLVEAAVATDYDAWATTNGATGQTPDQDHDNDGVENGVEYFMGQTGSSFTAMPGLDATNTITWPASATYQGTYEVQTSPNLVTWTNVDPRPVPSGGSLSYTLPSGAPGGKSFVRLLVTPTP